MNDNKFSKEDILGALEKTKGIIVKAAKGLGVSDTTVYNYIGKYELMPDVEALRQRFKDVAMNEVVSNLEGNPDFSLDFLKYLQRTEVGKNMLSITGDNMNITVSSEEDKDNLDKFLK